MHQGTKKLKLLITITSFLPSPSVKLYTEGKLIFNNLHILFHSVHILHSNKFIISINYKNLLTKIKLLSVPLTNQKMQNVCNVQYKN
jgi:hypothetical protein